MRWYFLVLATLVSNDAYGFIHKSRKSLSDVAGIVFRRSSRILFASEDRDQANSGEFPDLEQLKSLSTEELFEEISDYDQDQFSPEVKELIASRAQEEAPSDLEVRMNMLGINGFTIAGFILAAFMVSMNSIFGNGWLGDMFGLNPTIPPMTDATSVYNPKNQEKIRELQGSNVIDYDQVLKDIEAREKSSKKDNNGL